MPPLSSRAAVIFSARLWSCKHVAVLTAAPCGENGKYICIENVTFPLAVPFYAQILKIIIQELHENNAKWAIIIMYGWETEAWQILMQYMNVTISMYEYIAFICRLGWLRTDFGS